MNGASSFLFVVLDAISRGKRWIRDDDVFGMRRKAVRYAEKATSKKVAGARISNDGSGGGGFARLEFIFLRSVVTESLQLLDAIFHMRYAHIREHFHT